MIIGLTGQAGSGKDTVAEYLVQKYDFKQLSFAGILKEGMAKLFGLTEKQLNDPQGKEQVDARWGKTPRQLMQWMGTDVLRKHIREDFFVIQVESMIKSYAGRNIVISDARFLDECKMIWNLDGLIVKIIRSNHVGTTSKHISENLEVEPNYQINNDNDISSLHRKVDFLIKKIKTKSIDNQG